jgi:hypothetical protein
MVATITTATSTLGADLLTVAAIGLGIGVSIFGLKKGWSLVKKFTA